MPSLRTALVKSLTVVRRATDCTMTAKNLITFFLAYIVVHVVESLRLRSLFQRLGVYCSSSISLASFLLASVFVSAIRGLL